MSLMRTMPSNLGGAEFCARRNPSVPRSSLIPCIYRSDYAPSISQVVNSRESCGTVSNAVILACGCLQGGHIAFATIATNQYAVSGDVSNSL